MEKFVFKSSFTTLLIPLIIIAIFLIIFWFGTTAFGQENAPKISGKSGTFLGITFDKENNVVASDQGVEWHLPRLNERLPDNYLEEVIMLPPLGLNYEKNTSPEIAIRCSKSPAELFRQQLKELVGKDDTTKRYTLLVAKRTSSDARPLIATWYFTCIRTEKLNP